MADERGKLSWLCHDDSTKNTAQIISIIIAVVVIITFYCITLQLKWYSITNTKHTTVLYFRDVLALKLSQNFPDMLYRNLNKHILNLFYPFSLITVVYKAAPAKAEVTYIMWLITKQNDRGAPWLRQQNVSILFLNCMINGLGCQSEWARKISTFVATTYYSRSKSIR